MERSRARARLFWSIIAAVVISDVITKWIAYTELTRVPYPREVIGEAVRFWLVYNRGAAFRLNVGEYSRWIFLVLTIAALVILALAALALVELDREAELHREVIDGMHAKDSLEALRAHR